MTRSRARSLRSHLTVLVFASVVPVLVFAVIIVAVVEGAGRVTLWAVIGGGVVFLLLAGAFATMLGSRIARAIGTLSASARALGQGQNVSGTGGSRIAEVDDVERDMVEAARERAESVSERVKTEAALRESEATFRLLFSHNPLPMWVYDVATLYFLEVNVTAVAHYGYSRTEFLRMRISDIRPREDVSRLKEAVATLATSTEETRRHPGTWKHRLKDGRVIDVEVISHSMVFAGRRAVLVVAIDVTELKRAEESLSRYAERLRILHEVDRALIAEEAPGAIAAAALRRLRDLLGVPRAIVNMFDFAAGEVEWLAAAGRRRIRVGPGVRFPLALMGDVEALRRGEQQVIDVASLPPSPEAEALLAGGVHVYMVVPMIAGGELIGALSFGGAPGPFPPEQVSIAQEVATQLAIAIAQARLYERVKRQAAELEDRVQERTRELEGANRELEAFTYTVSHDLKAPLRGIEGFARALAEDYADRLDDTGRRYLGTIQTSVSRMGHLIDDLLRYARIERRGVDRRPVALKPLLDLLCEELAGDLQSRGLTVTQDLAVPEVPAEPEGLREALANLLSNAVKFSPDHGGTISVRSSRDGESIVVAVADRGIGFDMKYHDRIFGIFERLHRQEAYPGTGVGLAIVRKVAERHGGRAWAESEPGKGSVFSLSLPAPTARTEQP
jgi:PAS domain S-box-containing protein